MVEKYQMQRVENLDPVVEGAGNLQNIVSTNTGKIRCMDGHELRTGRYRGVPNPNRIDPEKVVIPQDSIDNWKESRPIARLYDYLGKKFDGFKGLISSMNCEGRCKVYSDNLVMMTGPDDVYE